MILSYQQYLQTACLAVEPIGYDNKHSQQPSF